MELGAIVGSYGIVDLDGVVRKVDQGRGGSPYERRCGQTTYTRSIVSIQSRKYTGLKAEGSILAMVSMGRTLFGSASFTNTRVTGPSASAQVMSKGTLAVMPAYDESVKMTVA